MCWGGGGRLGVEQTINLNLTKFKAQNKFNPTKIINPRKPT